MPGPRGGRPPCWRAAVQIHERNGPGGKLTSVLPNPRTLTIPERPQRRRLRLAGYDYAQAGIYFVTICTRGHLCLLGEVRDGAMLRSAAGETVARYWEAIPDHFPEVETDARPLQVVVGSFKSAVSRRLGAMWQRSYWERVVRDADELDEIRAYIEDNPPRWPADQARSHH